MRASRCSCAGGAICSFWRLAIALVASLPIAVRASAAPSDAARDILLVVADDISATELGTFRTGECPGCAPPPHTPHIDRLAAEGITYANVWANTNCSTTRATLVTGLYGFRNGVRENSAILDPAIETLPEALDRASSGYAHALFGKWHLAGRRHADPDHPVAAGFAYYAGTIRSLGGRGQMLHACTGTLPRLCLDPAPRSRCELSCPDGEACKVSVCRGDARRSCLEDADCGPGDTCRRFIPEDYFRWLLVRDARRPPSPADTCIVDAGRVGAVGGPARAVSEEALAAAYSATHHVDDVLAWAAKTPSPRFALLAFNLPHSPFQVPPAHLLPTDTREQLAARGLGTADICDDDTQRLCYRAMVEAMDAELGRLLAGLAATSAAGWDVIFVGDNGTPAVGDDPEAPDQAKGTLYQAGIHVPLVVRAARSQLPRGSVSDRLVNTVDLFGLVLYLAGVPAPPGLDAVPGKALLAPAAQPRRYAFAERGWEDSRQYAIRGERYKLICRPHASRPSAQRQLFDLAADPLEQSPIDLGRLSGSQRAAIDELRCALDDLLAGSYGNHGCPGFGPPAPRRCTARFRSG